MYGECMARLISTTVRLEEADIRALQRARAAGHSASALIRRGLRVVASRYYTGRRPPSTRLFESTDNKLGDESELFRDLETRGHRSSPAAGGLLPRFETCTTGSAMPCAEISLGWSPSRARRMGAAASSYSRTAACGTSSRMSGAVMVAGWAFEIHAVFRGDPTSSGSCDHSVGVDPARHRTSGKGGDSGGRSHSPLGSHPRDGRPISPRRVAG